MTGVLNTDGNTSTLIYAHPTTHVLSVSDGTSGSDLGDDIASRDNNHIPTLMAVSSSDGSTPTNLYVTSTGQLLIQST